MTITENTGISLFCTFEMINSVPGYQMREIMMEIICPWKELPLEIVIVVGSDDETLTFRCSRAQGSWFGTLTTFAYDRIQIWSLLDLDIQLLTCSCFNPATVTITLSLRRRQPHSCAWTQISQAFHHDRQTTTENQSKSSTRLSVILEFYGIPTYNYNRLHQSGYSSQ
jgi:hypothetical protein